MRANIAVPARSSRLVADHVSDPYKREPKHVQPVVCPDCGVIFQKGRWQWTQRHPKGAARETCQACRRIKDGYPGGILTLRGAFVLAHLPEIIAVARNVEKSEIADHPMHRIMAVEERRDRVVIKTTDIHLPGRIGRALVRARKGELDLKYDRGAYFVRADWTREA
jgi:hypothetical protein